MVIHMANKPAWTLPAAYPQTFPRVTGLCHEHTALAPKACRLKVGEPDQKKNFAPNWMILDAAGYWLAPRPSSELMRPKFGSKALESGLAKSAWLKKLNNSKRNSK